MIGASYNRAPFGCDDVASYPGTVRMTIGGQPAEGSLTIDSYAFETLADGRPTLSADLLVVGQPVMPLLGQWMRLTLDTTPLFYGLVHEFDRLYLTENSAARTVFKIKAVGWATVCDRRLVLEVYEGRTAGFIFRDLVAKYLASEGFTVGTVDDGPVISKAVFPDVFLSQAFDDLKEQSGLQWICDEYKVLHLTGATCFVAPFGLDASNAIFRKIHVKQSRDQYRNVQIMKGGHALSDAQTETFKGDGQDHPWTVSLPIGELQAVRVNGVARTFGIKQKDAGREFYYQIDSGEVSKDASFPLLTTSDILTVVYRGLYPIKSQLDNAAQIALRQAVESGTGRYEHIEVDESLDGEETVLEQVQGLMRQFSVLDQLVNAELFRDGLRAGQCLTITDPELGLTSHYLLTRVSCQLLIGTQRVYHIEASSGEAKNDFRAFFKKVWASGRSFTIRENEVLQRPFTQNDPLGSTDTFQVTTGAAGIAVVDIDAVDFSEVG